MTASSNISIFRTPLSPSPVERGFYFLGTFRRLSLTLRISTGVYGFPADKACQIATETVLACLPDRSLPGEVTFCCFSESDAEHYRKRLAECLWA